MKFLAVLFFNFAAFGVLAQTDSVVQQTESSSPLLGALSTSKTIHPTAALALKPDSATSVEKRFLHKNSVTGRQIEFIAGKSKSVVKYGARVQTRFDAKRLMNGSENNGFSRDMYVRRARVKADGYLFNPRVGFKFEADVLGGQILDAVLKYNFIGNFTLWAGQTKLPGNRERVISSANLQLVDRSLLNKKYNIDRDLGLQLRHHFNIGEFVVREILSVSRGEGKNFSNNKEGVSHEGYGYTGRLEFLPFGKFSGKGDYSGSDLAREKTPKLSVGVSFDYNDNAIRAQGQRGDLLSRPTDLSSWYVDAMFKYNGFSFMGEYTTRSTSEVSPIVSQTSDGDLETFYVGTGLNMQVGYLFKNNWEIAGRYTFIDPQDEIRSNEITEYTLGLSKYIIGHKVKAQTDISYQKEEAEQEALIYRLQLELSF
ncbi:porin [Flammeovirgaceae bacterium SG7u.111]|nr:porin [Flammeovirgaceae bacterium SG7u.132]WPO34785.1 porin [Flammeovirgaceae bacterium SG7u.111]